MQRLSWRRKGEVQVAKACILKESLEEAVWVHVTGVLSQREEDKTLSGPLSRPKGNINLKLRCLSYFFLSIFPPRSQYMLSLCVHPKTLWVSTRRRYHLLSWKCCSLSSATKNLTNTFLFAVVLLQTVQRHISAVPPNPLLLKHPLLLRRI